MAVHLQINPETEAELAARARNAGESLESFIQHLLEREVATSPCSPCNPAQALSGQQKADAFDSWARSFPTNLPLLSLDDITREKIYQPE